jgi:hypothetical protein
LSLLINMPLGIIQRIQEGNQEGYMFQLYQIFGSVFSFIALLYVLNLKLDSQDWFFHILLVL